MTSAHFNGQISSEQSIKMWATLKRTQKVDIFFWMRYPFNGSACQRNFGEFFFSVPASREFKKRKKMERKNESEESRGKRHDENIIRTVLEVGS